FVFRHSGAARSAEPGTQRLLHPWSGKPKSLGPGSPLRGVRDDANFFVTPIFRHSGESRNSSDFGPGMTTTKYPLARIFFHQLITCTPSPPEPLTWYSAQSASLYHTDHSSSSRHRPPPMLTDTTRSGALFANRNWRTPSTMRR